MGRGGAGGALDPLKPGRKSTKSVDPRTLSIGALSRATRIPAETLRTWERRYGSPRPTRRPSGHRVYAASSVEHLRLVARLLAQGHRPADVLSRSVAELNSLLAVAGAAPEPAARVARAVVAGDLAAPSPAELLRAAEGFDRDLLTSAFRTHWVRLGPLRFLEDLAAPYMEEVGRAWHEKALAIRHEHFASGCLADFLREVREPLDDAARGPRVVAAMLPGDAHEVGLLMASVLLAHRGCRVTYLGLSTPVEEIAAAARTGDVEAVALSLSPTLTRTAAASALAKLRGRLPARLPIWTGGAGAPPASRGIERFETLEALDRRLAALS